MVKFKKIMLITVIGIVVLFSGCTGNQEKTVAETAQPTSVQTTAVQSTATQTPEAPYQVQVTEVKTLQDCIVSSETKPCLLINLQVKNNNLKNLDFNVVKEEMVSKSGKRLGSRYDREVGLSNLCVRQSGLGFKLDAGTDKNVALCYPIAHKADDPALNVGAMINGERKEYGFDLIKYGLAD
ncbi:MAG: hypothetical protein OIN66_03220 [Candidatus Methanoperedens sp.]|nr:hypothetical protein [Candidatus Methanoperedens sp.]